MSDVRAGSEPEQPAPAAEARPDPLAGDWSEGLPGPVRPHGLPLPARLGELTAAAVASEAAASNGEPARSADASWSEAVAPPPPADGWAMAPPATEAAAAAGEAQAWQGSNDGSPWSGPAQVATDWDPNAPAPAAAHQWAAPPEPASPTQEWSASEPAAPTARPMGPSNAVPDEASWSAPPPSDGGDLSPEPPEPVWTRQGRPDLAPLAPGESLAAAEEDVPQPLAEDEAAALLRPVDDVSAATLLQPADGAANDVPAEPVSLLHPPGDLDPALQPVMDPTLQPVADGESVVPLHPSDHPDLPAPVDENAPPMATGAPRGATIVRGEHRVAIHTRGGRTRRGSVTDLDLARPQFPLQPQGGGSTEIVPHSDVKAIFFMLAPGEQPVPASGGKVRVTLSDGRSIEGHRDGPEGPQGFFLVPVDAQKTNTRRIYVARAAISGMAEL
jgi:hypothetical protein